MSDIVISSDGTQYCHRPFAAVNPAVVSVESLLGVLMV
jgi:hypothetical protein